jgi:Fic family protein
MYRLERAQLTSEQKTAALQYLPPNFEAVSELSRKLNSPEYRYWDTAKYRIKLPEITPEQGWFLINTFFRNKERTTKINAGEGEKFTWQKPVHFDALLHLIDTSLGGSLQVPARDLNSSARKEFIADSLMEEAIASSKLEGANTERKYAKNMLREGKAPKTVGDKMIVNNHRAMQLIEEKYKNEELSIETIQHLHQVLTEETLEKHADEGRLRCNEDDTVVVSDKMTGEIYHEGTDPKLVLKELEKLVEFANTTVEDKYSFTHPIIKAILIHFWIAYIHPFMDGNGRLARVLFYWSVARSGYWGFAYAPISKMITKSKGLYEKSYVYSEQDNYNLTYFIDYNLRKIEEAIEYLHSEIDKYRKGKSSTYNYFVNEKKLNERQAQMLSYLTEDPQNYTTPTIHSNIYGVSVYTALNDLKGLLKMKYVRQQKMGRYMHYFATEIANKLRK